MTALPPEVLERARTQAAEDRALLARLVASGRAKRDASTMSVPGAGAFVRDIERRVNALRPGMDTIRPNAKKAKKRRR